MSPIKLLGYTRDKAHGRRLTSDMKPQDADDDADDDDDDDE